MVNSELDNEIRRFISDWYSRFPMDQKSALKISLTKDIISDIIIEKNKIQNKKIFSLAYRDSGRLIWSIKKSLWFILWSIKWVLFYNRNANKKIILVAIGSNLDNTKNYLLQLNEIANSNNLKIILLNLTESFCLLKNNSFYYYPRFFYRKKLSCIGDNKLLLTNEIIKEINLYLSKYSIQFDKREDRLKSSINNLIQDFDSFTYLVDTIISPKKIVALIQDYDYTYNKFLYFFISDLKGIKTVSVDTSVVLYEHLYTKVFSYNHLVWGQYKKDLILKYNRIDPSKIIVIGKPFLKDNSTKGYNTNQNLWLYIAQSYTAPSMFTSGRSFSALKSNLIKLTKYQSEQFPYDELILRIHPADNPTQFDFGIKKSFNDSIDNYLKRAKIILIEDTTLALELFARGYPIVYILDTFGNDNIGLVKENLVPGIVLNEKYQENLETILNENFEISNELRLKNKEFYFGNYSDDQLYSVLQRILIQNEN